MIQFLYTLNVWWFYDTVIDMHLLVYSVNVYVKVYIFWYFFFIIIIVIIFIIIIIIIIIIINIIIIIIIIIHLVKMPNLKTSKLLLV